jgi:hypothetical protein
VNTGTICCQKSQNILRRFVTQAASGMLPSKKDELLQGMAIEK